VGRRHEFRGFVQGAITTVDKAGGTTIVISLQPQPRLGRVMSPGEYFRYSAAQVLAEVVRCRFDALAVIPGDGREVIVTGVALPPDPADFTDPKVQPYRLDHCTLRTVSD
jgi:hypothetical protein